MVLYDLLLEKNGNTFQIDCIIIQQQIIWHLEIKNFEGDFLLRDKTIYSLAPVKEIINPLNQLERSGFLLKQLLAGLGFNIPLKSYLIFVHPSFMLYQPETAKIPIIHRTQILRFIHQKLNKNPSQLNRQHDKLAHYLFSAQVEENQKKRLPAFEFDRLQKGIWCLRCGGCLYTKSKNKLHCNTCGYAEGRESAVIRSAAEFNLLFPKKRMTTSVIPKWTGGPFSIFLTRKILKQYMIPIGNGKHMYFTFPTD